jgi:hypothetical protein
MKYLKRTIGFLVIALVIFVCGASFLHNTVRPSPEIKSLMDAKIDDFHQKLIQNKFAEIYAESDPELKDKYSEQEFIDYLKKAKEKFGNDLPKANVNSQESLINTIGRKLGKKVFQQELVIVSEKPNYKSEMFRWVLYSNDNIKLLSCDY